MLLPLATLIDEKPDLVGNPTEILQNWTNLSHEDRFTLFKTLSREDQTEIFTLLGAEDQSDLFAEFRPEEKKWWVRVMDPDDLADLIQILDEEERPEILRYLDPLTRTEVVALLAYREDEAGGLMNTRYARLRPEMTVDQALKYLRMTTISQAETIYYSYILDQKGHLLGVVSLRELFKARSDRQVTEVMTGGDDLVTVQDNMDQEKVGELFEYTGLSYLPVIDSEGVMKGLVTVDDIVDVVNEEATEDIQKLGGMEALDLPYFKTSFLTLVRKRAGWLMILFLGEMFTATAMGKYEEEIARAVVLALFIPMIISSGGNSGSQASTLVIRAMTLGEIALKDWPKVFWRELASGLMLGILLGLVGLLRIVFWPSSMATYGEHYVLVGATVGVTLVGIVLWGSLSGSMLPFALKRLGFDPASASAPFVATLVDVTGLVIYFSVAKLLLSGTLL
jgi:magnesium transporter